MSEYETELQNNNRKFLETMQALNPEARIDIEALMQAQHGLDVLKSSVKKGRVIIHYQISKPLVVEFRGEEAQ